MDQNSTYDATSLLKVACEKHGIDLCVLVAETALWAAPEVPRRLIEETGSPCFFPKTRRYRKSEGERRGEFVDGVRMDDNTYANHAIRQSLGVGRKACGFEVCHIWPRSCYDEACHTAIPNLVLLPRSLAGLSDHDDRIQAALQYHSFGLYGWKPPNAKDPSPPSDHPACWRPPLPFSDRIAKAIANRRARK